MDVPLPLIAVGRSHVLSINGMWEESFVGVFHNLLYGKYSPRSMWSVHERAANSYL